MKKSLVCIAILITAFTITFAQNKFDYAKETGITIGDKAESAVKILNSFECKNDSTGNFAGCKVTYKYNCTLKFLDFTYSNLGVGIKDEEVFFLIIDGIKTDETSWDDFTDMLASKSNKRLKQDASDAMWYYFDNCTILTQPDVFKLIISKTK
ncbi:MAG: hypothetical protein WCT77_03025 [Bacteroidota bacterium]|jgi:hypothetical protein